MKKSKQNGTIARVLTGISEGMLTVATNSRCVFCFHQPKMPASVHTFKRK